jgi:translocation and assembly module TamA
MKKAICLHILVGLLCCLISLPIFAQETSLFTVTGVTGDVQKNVESRLTVLQKGLEEEISQNEMKSFSKKAPDEIREALKPFGYFYPRISNKPNYINGVTKIEFRIDPGPPLYITKIFLEVSGEGKNNSVLQKALTDFPLKPREILDTSLYDKFKKQLFNTALEEGYLQAYFVQQEIRINLTKKTCFIILELNTGPRYYFGPLSFSKTPLKNSLLKRYAPFQTGDPFSSQQLVDLQNLLLGSNYFQSVSIGDTRPQPDTQSIPVDVNLNMKKRKEFLWGIGFGTDTGPRMTTGANLRYVNSEGHYINSLLVLSPVQSSLQAGYFIPGENPTTDKYSLNASITNNKPPAGESRVEQFGVNQIKLLDNNWQRIIYLNEEFEQYKFNSDDIPHTSYLLIPGIRLSNTYANDRIFPTQGNRFSFRLEGSPFSGISSNQFIQTEIQDKFITHFTDNDRLILSGDAGYSAVHNLDLFPLSHYFYAGGTQSVRGYPYQGLGPGRYLLTTSVEFQQKIYGKWYGAVFYDAGNAANNLNTPLMRSTGIGIVWASPIGTMELTIAKALSLPDQPNRIQFTMGADL